MSKPGTPSLRQTPHNIEAEQALLGAILINNEALSYVTDIVTAEQFFEPIHRHIFATSAQLISAGKLVTPVTLKEFIPADLDIAGLTTSQYLARLAAEATTIINAPDFATVIRDMALRRSLIRLSEDMANRAYDAAIDEPPTLQIEAVERALYELTGTGNNASALRSQGQLTKEAIGRAGHAYQHAGSLSGLSTGFRDLDQLMGGLKAPDLIILAGRPGMGKTALATNVACSVASNNVSALFFSLEMSGEQLGLRMLAEHAGLSSSEILRGEFKPEEFDRMQDAAKFLQHPLFVDDSGGLSIAQLVARARRLHRQRSIQLVVVDYLQLLRGTTWRSAETRVQEITEVTAGLKALAKELNVPVLALSQLSRAVEGRDDKRPHLPTSATAAPSSRTPILCSSYFARPTTTRYASPMTRGNWQPGRSAQNRSTIPLRSSSQNIATAQLEPLNCSLSQI